MMTTREHGRHDEVPFRIEKDKLTIERDDEVAVAGKHRTKLDKTKARLSATVGGDPPGARQVIEVPGSLAVDDGS